MLAVKAGLAYFALVLLLAAELLLAVALQERSLADYLASRDRVSGSVYLAMLMFFAVLPVFVERPKRAGGRRA